MRLLTWITAAFKEAWLALRDWWRQCRAEDAVDKLVTCTGTVPGGGYVCFPTATATVSGKRAGGAIVSRNAHTIWFQLAGGNIIKRHIRKHNVIETAW